jgi:HD-GYP domain-containing protein (c-di-GMP phosphodiesterase class II)
MMALKNRSGRSNEYIQITEKLNFSTDLLFHGYNVGIISYEIAKSVGLEDYEDMLFLGIFHDIGKSCISPSILYKPTKLTSEEFEVVKKHVLYSEKMILDAFGSTPKTRHLAKIIKFHHENQDGSGYIHGLAGDSIPIQSKVLALADVFDAIINPRVYRPYPLKNPIEIMEMDIGKKFDKELFQMAKPIFEKWKKNL